MRHSVRRLLHDLHRRPGHDVGLVRRRVGQVLPRRRPDAFDDRHLSLCLGAVELLAALFQEQLNPIGGDVALTADEMRLGGRPGRIRRHPACLLVDHRVAGGCRLHGLRLLGFRIDLVEEHHTPDVAARRQVPALVVDDDDVALDLRLLLPQFRLSGIRRHAGCAVVVHFRRGGAHRLILLEHRRHLRRSPAWRRGLCLSGRRAFRWFRARGLDGAAHVGFGVQLLRADGEVDGLRVDEHAAIVERWLGAGIARRQAQVEAVLRDVMDGARCVADGFAVDDVHVAAEVGRLDGAEARLGLDDEPLRSGRAL